MKKLKLVLWIFVLYIIQNIFYPIISVTGIIPDLLLGFVVSYSALEHRFNKLSPVIIICAMLAGTGTGRVFPITVALTGFAGVASYIACGYMKFIPQIIRTQSVTLFFAFLMCVAEYRFRKNRDIRISCKHCLVAHNLYNSCVVRNISHT